MDLNSIMEVGHVIRVAEDGTVTDDVPGVWAPELLMSVGSDGQILDSHEAEFIESARAQGWDLLTGWTGQYSYSGCVMHPSEYVGGALARHILDTPGLYAVITVETDDDSEEAAGWAIAYRDDAVSVTSESYRCPCCGDDVIARRPVCGDCQAAGCEQIRDAGGDLGYGACQRETEG